MSARPLLRFAGSAAATTLFGILLLTPPPAEATDPIGFQASTSAIGVRATITIPNGPLASQVVDSGGPTAQASLDVGGNGAAYAAFPDPGPFIGDLPGLAKGLLQVPVPLPDYPLRITADSTKPDVSVGTGVYQLDASQHADKTSALASSGVGVGANVALVQSKADVTVKDNGNVVATAVSDVQGVTVGPLTLGQIKSTVTRTLSPTGQITTAASSEISGVRIGTIPISIDQSSINVLGTSVPLPIGDVANTLLKVFKIKLTVLPSTTAGDTVTTGALQISGPLNTGNLGTSEGDFAIVIGQASVTMIKGAAPSIPVDPDSPTVDPGTSSGPIGTGGTLPPIAGAPINSGGIVPAKPSADPQMTPAVTNPVMSLAAQLAGLRDAFGISNLYLVVAFTAAAAFLTESLVRLLGVRGPWTSTRG